MCHDGIIMVVKLIMCITVFRIKVLMCKNINNFRYLSYF